MKDVCLGQYGVWASFGHPTPQNNTQQDIQKTFEKIFISKMSSLSWWFDFSPQWNVHSNA